MLSSSCEDEDIKESHEGTDVRELDDCYNGSFGKNGRGGNACWPWCLGVMSLGDCQCRENGSRQKGETITVLGSHRVPMNPITVKAGS